MNDKNVVILTGPTAVGKTALSIALAKALDTGIISADSMQVYKHMDIGSAKVTPEEMQDVPHALVDVYEPGEEFHVVQFQHDAKAAMERLWAQGRLPLVVGGTGFYIQALLYDIDFTTEDADRALREKYENLAATQGPDALHEMLRTVDPQSAKDIHPNNVKRVIRALEFYEKTGTPISAHNEKERAKKSPYGFAYFVLTDQRERLYARIDARVDAMMAQGLLDEVRALKEMGYTRDCVAMQGLGYKELLAYLDGECSLEEAVYIIKRDTRHFAKRQLTWFRRERDVIWVDKSSFDYDDEKILKYMLEEIEKRGLNEWK
ncbi:MAG: tRNA (adenosine(37)-N6)-dimethylallyltransferase MiaA [Lachnospiraceae bacterium]|nr:tRNA (adenosine(37)-N6)-dimethylallyltransferase MiaA [bacterium]MDY5517788.1 tRNA (adenosine(37)-N6)-dimethylallyltransferase MiaA [Lachnospiraceae bacterium]